MNLQTFKAATMAAAVQQVKSAMGHDAVILHTRTYKVRGWLPLLTKDVVEVTAGRGLAGAGGRRRPPVAPPGSGAGVLSIGPAVSPGDSVHGVLALAAEAHRAATAAAGAPASPGGSVHGLALYGAQAKPGTAPIVKVDPIANGRALAESPAAGNALILNVSQEVAALKALVRDLVSETRHNSCPKMPDELFDHYLTLIQNQVAEEIALQIVRQLQKDLRPDQLAQPETVRERMAEHIERLVPSCPPTTRKPAAADGTRSPHVLALIGPTGVGKTTTLAKLAANLKLKEGHKVGLITLDTYRIAAVDQLRKYAEILNSPLRVVATVDELRSAVAGMSHLDFVLIDTAGRSPNDAAKLAELKELLQCIQPDDVHLVLSSTSSQRSVELAYERFSGVRVDKMIFTKLDEASHVGVVLNVCHKVKKALSYVTTGQDVPNDIEVGRGRVLARMILQGPVPLPAPAPVPSLA